MKKIIFIISLIFLLTSCVSTSPTFQLATPKNNHSLIYIYRPKQFAGTLMSWPVFIDQKRIGKLRNETYLVENITPGLHVIKIESARHAFKKARYTDIAFISEPEKIYFFRYDDIDDQATYPVSIIYARTDILNHRIVAVNANDAMLELQSLHRSKSL